MQKALIAPIESKFYALIWKYKSHRPPIMKFQPLRTGPRVPVCPSILRLRLGHLTLIKIGSEFQHMNGSQNSDLICRT